MPTVLLVDDDPGIRDILRSYAENSGLAVVGEAADGREAVELAVRLQPDVIVLDHEMPEMTGLDALPRVRRRVPHALIVLYTGDGFLGLRKSALALGADAYITKADTPRTVIRTIVELLASSPRAA